MRVVAVRFEYRNGMIEYHTMTYREALAGVGRSKVWGDVTITIVSSF